MPWSGQSMSSLDRGCLWSAVLLQERRTCGEECSLWWWYSFDHGDDPCHWLHCSCCYHWPSLHVPLWVKIDWNNSFLEYVKINFKKIWIYFPGFPKACRDSFLCESEVSLILIILYRHPIPKKKNGNAENKVAGCKQTYVSRIFHFFPIF